MKNKIILICLSALFLILPACNEDSTSPRDEITAKPVVKKSTLDYTKATFNISFPDTNSLNSMSKAYSNNFSSELRNKIIEYLKGEVVKLGEDVNTINNILSSTGCITAEYIRM